MTTRTASELVAWANVPAELATLTVRVAQAHGFNLVTIRGQARKRPLFRCRCAIATEARAKGYSYPQIGRALNRDHSTIVQALRAKLA